MTITPVGPSAPSLPPVLAGMGREEALAFVSRMFDASAAGDSLWDDEELVERFLSQCSRTSSPETRSGYAREIHAFQLWRWGRSMARQQVDPLPMRSVSPGEAQDWVDHERGRVEAGDCKPRTFNRRVAAVSALYRWASEPSRSGFTGVPRNPLPRRSLITVDPMPRPLPEGDLTRVVATLEDAGRSSSRGHRDLVIVRGLYLTGLRVSELASLKWESLEVTATGGRVTVRGKGSKVRRVVVSAETLALFNSIRPEGAAPTDWVFPSQRRPGERMTRQAIGSIVRKWGRRAKDAGGNPIHLWSHRLRHQHASTAVERGCDPFVLQRSMGWASLSTATHYVAAAATDGSSLRLG